MIKARLGGRLDAWLKAALPFLFRRPLDPNVLTVCGTLVSLGAAVAFGLGELVWGGVLVLAGGAFDLVDGVIARHNGSSSAFGAFLDSTLDRLVDLAIVIGLMVHYASRGEPEVVLLAGWGLAASIVVSYAKARAEHWLAHFEGGLLERGERIGLLAAGGILDLMVPVLWIIGAAGTYTAIQRVLLAWRLMQGLPPDPRALSTAGGTGPAKSGNGAEPPAREDLAPPGGLPG